MEPEEIPVQQLTHLIVAFGYVTPGDFRVTNVRMEHMNQDRTGLTNARWMVFRPRCTKDCLS